MSKVNDNVEIKAKEKDRLASNRMVATSSRKSTGRFGYTQSPKKSKALIEAEEEDDDPEEL